MTTWTCFTPELWAGTCFKHDVGKWWENRVWFLVQILFIALDNTEPERKAWHAGDAWWYFNKGNRCFTKRSSELKKRTLKGTRSRVWCVHRHCTISRDHLNKVLCNASEFLLMWLHSKLHSKTLSAKASVKVHYTREGHIDRALHWNRLSAGTDDSKQEATRASEKSHSTYRTLSICLQFELESSWNNSLW